VRRVIIKSMKREMMEILACPVCKGNMELTVVEENEEEIVTGSLYCPKCQVHYPVENTISNLLPPDEQGQSGV